MKNMTSITDVNELKNLDLIPDTFLPNKWKFVYGDIVEAKEDCIVHVVNCRGVMGAGVALAIKNKWPFAFKQYQDYTKNTFDRAKLLGQCYIVDSINLFSLQTDKEDYATCKLIANCFAQFNYSRNIRELNYEYLARCLFNLVSQTPQNRSFVLPLFMGCGLAGGDWNIVYPIICLYLQNREVTFYVKT